MKSDGEILSPQCGALAKRERLRGLKVREAQARKVALLGGECGDAINDAREFVGDKFERVAQNNRVGVANNILTGHSQMNEALRGGRGFAKGVHVRHDIMAQTFFMLGHRGEIRGVDIGAHVVNGGLRNVHAKFLLRLRHGQPYAAP